MVNFKTSADRSAITHILILSLASTLQNYSVHSFSVHPPTEGKSLLSLPYTLTVPSFKNHLQCHQSHRFCSRSFSHASPFRLSSTKSAETSTSLNTNSTKVLDPGGSSSNTTVDIVSPDETSLSAPTLSSPPSKIRQLKDRMWVRETLEDLTSAEFACSLSPESSTNSATGVANKRSVDFGSLLQKLDLCVEKMCVDGIEGGDKCFFMEADGSNQCFLLKNGEGMGSVVYTHEQREALLLRIMSTRERLTNAMSGATTTTDEPNLDQIRSQLQDKSLSSEETKNVPNAESSTIFPNIYIRDDGSVDWDGALQDRDALKLFGTSVWARINGKDPDLVNDEDILDGAIEEEDHEDTGVRVQIKETEQIIELREALDDIRAELFLEESKHRKLLNSAIAPTTANPTVKMASISSRLRAEIKESTALLERKRGEVTFATLNYELERVFTYLEADLGNTFSKGPIPLQDRLTVAEFGLLESQITALNDQLQTEGESDSDVLQVVMEQMTDFKRRLGIDYYVNVNPKFNSDTIKRWSADFYESCSEGLQFYGKGLRLLLNDIIFCFQLLNRAVQGYTLKPREVRTLRRTIMDVITFIPFVIILLIPLSPVGHVFVFSAIRKFYPDLFPSMFTESRQNLLQLYESTEYSEIIIKETLREKFLRFSEATMQNLSIQLGLTNVNNESEGDGK